MRKTKLTQFLWLIFLSMLINSCSILQPNRMFNMPKDFEYDEFESFEEKDYRLQPYDMLSISITTLDGHKLINTNDGQPVNNQQNRKGEIEFLIEYDGQVKLPNVGRIEIAGKTIREAEAFLEEKYAKFFQKPFVLLKVNNRKVYIFKGGGENGSIVNIPEDRLTLIEALAMSGGIPDGDKAFKIKLIRGDVSNNPKVYLYNVSSLKDIQGSNLLLQANDIIYIESRPRYIRRIMVEITPYLSLLSTILLVYSLF